jgi:HAD superfamily hydrolase (TIGR01549 family)
MGVVKAKIYGLCVKSRPNVEEMYYNYKKMNTNFHNAHKLRSLLYLSKLIRADKKKECLLDIDTPLDSINPYKIKTVQAETVALEEINNCKAIPDSRLLARKPVLEFAEELKDYEIVSFDIFDTCIFRPFQAPTDLYYLLEAKNKILGFSDIRKNCEAKARAKTKKPNFEVDIYDIYEEISKSCRLHKEDAEKEIELELDVCYANPYILELYKILKNNNKRIVFISDMYLPSCVLQKILEKNGFYNANEIYVSNEYGYNKASGMLFKVVKDKYPIDNKIAHIGDNFESDIKGAAIANIAAFHYIQCNAFGGQYRPSTLCSPVSSVYKGIINNYMYCGAYANTAREDFGFIYAGITVSGFCEWVNNFTRNNNLEHIVFFARDMDIFYKMYRKHYCEYDNEYAIVSRFALQELIAKDFPDEFLKHTIHARCNRGYTIGRALNEVNLSFLMEYLEKYSLNKNDFIIPSKIDKLEKLVKENIDKIAEYYSDNEKAARDYFAKKLKGHRRICLVELGWRGSILSYLNYLLVEKWNLCDEVKGVLLGSTVNETSINLISRGVVTSFAYNHVLNRDFLRNHDWEVEYINLLLMESIFSSEEPSLIEYRYNEHLKETEFITYEDNPNKKYIQEFQNGISKFIEVFEGFRKKYREFYPISAVDAFEAMHKCLVNYEYIARVIGDVVDTPYAIAGFNINKRDYIPIGKLMLDRGMIKNWPIL